MLKEIEVKKFKAFFKNALKKCDDTLPAQFFQKTGSEGPGDEVDKFNVDRQTQMDLKLKWRNALFHKKVTMALKKIANGTFGDCEDCGGHIQLKRLRARPTATMCISCKEEQEKVENHIPYAKKSHTSGKMGGLFSETSAHNQEDSIQKAEVMGNTIKTANRIALNAENPY